MPADPMKTVSYTCIVLFVHARKCHAKRRRVIRSPMSTRRVIRSPMSGRRVIRSHVPCLWPVTPSYVPCLHPVTPPYILSSMSHHPTSSLLCHTTLHPVFYVTPPYIQSSTSCVLHPTSIFCPSDPERENERASDGAREGGSGRVEERVHERATDEHATYE